MQRFSSSMLQRSVPLNQHYLSWRPLLKRTSPPPPAANYALLLFLLILLTASFMGSTLFSSDYKATKTILTDRKIDVPLNCAGNHTQTDETCSTSTLYYQTISSSIQNDVAGVCPEYFRWIHEDLGPWKADGITKEMVEMANRTAHFRLVIIKGRAYVETFKKSIQTRDAFTIWGILQLLRRYPGSLPDLELMFDCNDRPVIRAHHYRRRFNMTAPPPLFRYCGDRWTQDIVFPDWSFWGWAETNIRPWEHLLEEIKEGNKKIKWNDRDPHAYWKGNPFVAQTRQDLLKCNVSDTQDWNARLFLQDWIRESEQGYSRSNLANQCTHRFKIYIEGYAWSVSEKYILACDSPTLFVGSSFYDFFVRSLQPTQHYWPIRSNDKCKSIKYAVEWGNNNTQKAEEIGKAASRFIQEELKMEYVYDYMFHLLKEYAKLLKFEPKVPEGGVEVCAESMACSRTGLEKKFMIESLVKSPSTRSPCSLPPPLEPTSLKDFYRKRLKLIMQVEKWEHNYWSSKPDQKHTTM